MVKGNNNILMYSIHNESKSVITERFIETLKAKIYKKLTANDIKSYPSSLNKLVDQYNNTYHRSIGKKPITADYNAWTEKTEANSKGTKFKFNDRVRFTKYKNILVKVTLKVGKEKYLLLILFWKLILGLIKVKDLNGKKVIGSFCEKELLLTRL